VIIVVVGLAFALLVYSIGSVANFYAGKAATRRLAKIVDEIVRGAHPSFSNSQTPLPPTISQALRKLHKALRTTDNAPDPLLWDLGHAIGEACRCNGYQDGLQVGAIPPDTIRIEMSLNELLQMSWLAHLGFQHMMPNFRGTEIHRFSGPDDAREGARSVGLLECAIPRAERPFADLRTQLIARENMIADWWKEAPALQSA
jgi:hypothetical protein